MRILNREDVSDLCMGATVLGTGGGGSPELGLFILNRMLEMGKEIRMVSVGEVPDEEIVIHPAMVGSIAPVQKKKRDEEEYITRLLSVEGPLLSGLRILEEVLSKNIYATVPVELGGYNTPVAAILAALAGLPFVDGDTIGRAKPELMMQTYTIHNIPITPMVLTDIKGNSVLVRKVSSFKDAEKIASVTFLFIPHKSLAKSLLALIDLVRTASGQFLSVYTEYTPCHYRLCSSRRATCFGLRISHLPPLIVYLPCSSCPSLFHLCSNA